MKIKAERADMAILRAAAAIGMQITFKAEEGEAEEGEAEITMPGKSEGEIGVEIIKGISNLLLRRREAYGEMDILSSDGFYRAMDMKDRVMEQTRPKLRKLFVSFTGLLGGIYHGTVTAEDLDKGIFYFGCTARHVEGIWEESTNEILWFWKDHEEGRRVHTMILGAIEKAEREGRIKWRVVGECGSYDGLSELLMANGHTAIPSDPWRTCNGPYCYPGVRDRVEEQGIALDVVS